MSGKNPFTPSFGKVPLVMAGRSLLVEDIVQAFENGVGDPNLSSIFVGPRGTGKTALLLYLSQEAASRGWIYVNVTAVPGMLEDILERARIAAAHLAEPQSAARITGVTLGQVLGVEWETDKPQGNWRTRMSLLIDELNAQGVGLLITVDEVRVELDEMIQLASVYQHFVGENKKVALFMAGLPGKISSLLRNDSISFLRRACLHRLGRISDGEICEALQETAREGGREIAPDALQEASEAIEGFPYMMQLVGYRMWGKGQGEGVIGLEDARLGIALARHDFRERVLDATYFDLSQGDLRFLRAMLEDAAESRVADVAERLGEGSNYASTYKRRLVEQGVIGERGRSSVAFELPEFKRYLKEKMAD